MERLAAAGLGLAFLLTACATPGPQFHVPEQAVIHSPAASQAFLGTQGDAVVGSAAPDTWWRLYEDSRLDQLVEQSLAANLELRVAAANLARSQAYAHLAEAYREPAVGAAAGAERARLSAESYLLEQPLPVFNLGDAGIHASYTLDLAGGLAQAAQASQADAEADQAARDSVRIQIIADTVLAYQQACAAGQQLEIDRTRLALQQQQFEHVARLVAGGRATVLELPRMRDQIAQTRAALPRHGSERRLALYRLAVLGGRGPADYPRDLEDCRQLAVLRQPIPVGDGAALLRRRPDVRQAERRLAGAAARVGVATAALYPTVTLGLSGGASGLLEHVGMAQTQRWSIGPLISWTLPGAAERSRVSAAEAGAGAALAQFDAVVLHALQEVESALVVLAADLERQQALAQARDAAVEARRQVDRLHRAGRLGVLDDLEARHRLSGSEAALAAASAQLASDQVRLFLALGGGWVAAAGAGNGPAGATSSLDR